MLQLSSKTRPENQPRRRSAMKAETALARVMRSVNETVIAINEQELCVGGTPLDVALYHQLDNLYEEASRQLPETEGEAAFQLLLAGGMANDILDSHTRKLKTAAADRQVALITAALSFFQKHKTSFPDAWDFVAFPLSVVTKRGAV